MGASRDEAGAGQVPVVLLHGARTSGTMWRAQLDALERAGRPAIAPDLPGHGRRMDEAFTVDACLDAIGEAVEGVGGRAVVVGLSLGGYLGIRWAADNPDRTAGLLVSGCCTEPDRWLTDVWRYAAVLIGRLPDRGARLNQLLVDLAIPDEGGAALGEGGFALDVMVELLGAMRALTPLDDLARVRCPVRVVNGSLDHFRLQERAFLAAALGAERVLVTGATHLVALTHPVAYNRALLGFLDAVDPARPV